MSILNRLWIPALLGVAFTARCVNADQPPPFQLTAQEDQRRLLDLLHISSLRRGADGRNADAPNAANYDESKQNIFVRVTDLAGLQSPWEWLDSWRYLPPANP